MGLPMMLYGAKHIKFVLAEIGSAGLIRANVQSGLVVVIVTSANRLHIPYVARIALVPGLWHAIHCVRCHWRS